MAVGDALSAVSGPIADAQSFLSGTQSLLSPKSAKGISGFVFDIDLSGTLHLQADTSDHYVENGSFVNDQVIVKPAEFTLSGYVGELVWKAPGGLLGLARSLTLALSQVSGYLGNYSPAFLQQSARIVQEADAGLTAINSALNTAQNTIAFLQSRFGQTRTRQQKAFQALEALFLGKSIVTVLTPWKYYPSMIIKDLQFVQDESTQDRSEITVTVKEFRPADTQFILWSQNLLGNPNQVQSADASQTGVVQSDDGNTALYDLSQSLGGTKKLTAMVGQ